jgi:phage gpG-like protein
MQFKISKQFDSLTPELVRIQRALAFNAPRRVTRAMARRFWEITRNNFGSAGEDRPEVWSPLSQSYIRQLIRKGIGPLIPTLLRRGLLMNSIRLTSSGKTAEVWTDNPYAMAHQFGYGKIPRRAYFPVVSRENESEARLTPYAESEVLKAGKRELDSIL